MLHYIFKASIPFRCLIFRKEYINSNNRSVLESIIMKCQWPVLLKLLTFFCMINEGKLCIKASIFVYMQEKQTASKHDR